MLLSNLRNRVLYVACNAFKSSSLVATFGVPPGSTFGALLVQISVFINDFIDSLLQCLMYTDDLMMYHTAISNTDCLMLQSTLEKGSQWCQNNLLISNTSKCYVVAFGQ